MYNVTYAQEKKESEKMQVPESVKSAFLSKYADARNVTWEKEKGNFEANWGGKSREDNSVMFTPQGKFIEIVKTIPVSDLPKSIIAYVERHYNGSKISEAGRVTDVKDKTFMKLIYAQRCYF